MGKLLTSLSAVGDTNTIFFIFFLFSSLLILKTKTNLLQAWDVTPHSDLPGQKRVTRWSCELAFGGFVTEPLSSTASAD